MSRGLNHLHENNICHRDVQPCNFLLKRNLPIEQNDVKLIDLSTSKEFGHTSLMRTKICTPHYVAPEILTRHDEPYTEKIDVWSLGVVFFIILCGLCPFNGETEID